MTVGTRMWSEQPNPVQAMRGPVVAEPLVDVPVDMAQSWAGVWEHNAAYGDGQIYGRPPASLPVHILAPAGGIPTGVPVLVLIKSDMWDGFTPPAGWVKEWEVPNGDSCAAAWKIDKYAGQDLIGACKPNRIPGLSGANFRIQALTVISDTKGRWSSTPGAWTDGAMVLSDPGGLHRFQWAASQVRYDRGWTPPLSMMDRYGDIWSGSWVTRGIDLGRTWQDAAWLRTGTMGVGTYTPDVGGATLPANVQWVAT
jgi:hypothetical protein